MARNKSVDNVVRQFTTYLPCRLTEDEQRERGQQLAHQRKLVEDFAVEAGDVKKRLKEHETNLDGELSRLARVVRDRSEPRQVLVHVRLSKKAGYVDVVRTDTGEVIQTRKMASEEAQTEMLDMPPSGGADEIPFGREA